MKLARLCVVTFIALAALGAAVVQAMPLHPNLIEQFRDQPGRLEQEMRYEEQLRARGVNEPTLVPRLRELAGGGNHLDENFNIIAILVDFSDNVAVTATSFFDTLMVGSGPGTVRNYINEVTYGNVTLVTVNMPSALGWRRAPQTYAYYVDGQRGFGSYPHNAQKMAEDAIALANPAVNFSNYDNDDDNFVDALFIIHAGPGYEYTGNVNHIHSHKWSTSYWVPVDGVYCSVYSTEPEYWSSSGDMTCGVYAHEMGHAAWGLPDLYDYGGDSRGLGYWSLMASGSWNGSNGDSPAHPDAYCRIEMGAVTPTNLLTNLMTASIPAIENTPTIYRLWTNGTTGSEYFLVENRRRTGYDIDLPSQGLLIYHIDETEGGNDHQWYPGHTGSGNYLVALEQADGLYELEQDIDGGDGGDPFPGSTVNRTFDSLSTPDSRAYSGAATQVAVRTISNTMTTMTADLYVTGATLTMTSPNGGEVWYTGESRAITWSGSGFSGNVKIELNRTYPVGGWETLYASTSNDGTQNWTVSGTVTSQARMRVTSVSLPAITDLSDANFTIAAPFISLLAPDGGEMWTVGFATPINWSSGGFSDNVKIELNRAYPSGTWETLFASTSNDGSESWTPTTPATQTARVRISRVSAPSLQDVSAANFTIYTIPPRIVHNPLGDVTTGSGTVRVLAFADDPIMISSVVMYYRAAGGSTFSPLNLSATGLDDEWAALLSAHPAGTYEYFIQATDNFGISNTLPLSAPTYLYSFDVGDLCGVEISYDDGTAERYNWCDDANGASTEWAVKFGPVSIPYALCGVRFVASRLLPDTAYSPVYVTVYAADGPFGTPGTIIYTALTGSIGNIPGGMPAGTHWANVIIREETGSPVLVNDPEFYVSVTAQDLSELEGFGRDVDGTRNNRSYFYDPCESQWFSENDTTVSENAYPGNRMIRLYGYPVAGPAVTVNRDGDYIRLFWTNTLASSYNVYAAPTFGGTFSLIGSTTDTFFTVSRVDTAALMKFYEVRSVVE